MQSRTELEQELAELIKESLTNDIKKQGHASLLVSGGSTPKALFERLSAMELDWQHVTISLVDERFVADDHPDQNGRMLRSALLQNHASKARFLPLVLDSEDAENNLQLVKAEVQKLPRPLSVVILGMGGDGHTASLFPDAPELDEAMDLKTEAEVMITHPQQAPYERITFTRKALLNSSTLLLHCYGMEKKRILDEVAGLSDYRPFPIQGFMQHQANPMQVYWTE